MPVSGTVYYNIKVKRGSCLFRSTCPTAKRFVYYQSKVLSYFVLVFTILLNLTTMKGTEEGRLRIVL